MAYRISPWDRAAFKRCRRAWDLGATERQNREPVEPPRRLDFAAALREALAVYYFPGMWAWDRSIVRPLAVEAYLEAVRRQQSRVRDLTVDETRAWAERLEIGAEVLQRYFEWAPRVDDFSVMRFANDFAVNLPDPHHPGHDLVSGGEPVRYAGTIDLLVQEDSAHWLVRHVVTQGAWRDAAQLRLDEEGSRRAAAGAHRRLRAGGGARAHGPVGAGHVGRRGGGACGSRADRTGVRARARWTRDNEREGGRRMIARLLGTALAIGVAYVVVTSLPDIARYMKIREM